MNTNNQNLMKLLNCALYYHKPQEEIGNPIDWNLVFEEAFAHQVHSILYPVLADLNLEHGPDQELLKHWRDETLQSAKEQLQHVHQIGTVLNELHLSKIPVVALKGLVIREYYPQPELRTMGDADILIPIDQLKATGDLLKSLGYLEGVPTVKHSVFYHKYFPGIEVHWALKSINSYTEKELFTQSIWENTIPTELFGAPVLILSNEDQVLHLLLHAVDHIQNNGFGLRQLCDFVLFIEAKKEIINWEIIYDQVSSYHIHRFSIALFEISHRLFGLKIPALFSSKEIENSQFLEVLIEDIFDSGVYGRKNLDRLTSCKLARYMDKDIPPHRISKLAQTLTFLFPPLSMLHMRYKYAHKHPITLPIAWIHRAINNITSNKLIGKINSNEIIAKSEDRAKLLQWLELH
jgi:hypothetical protein